MSEKFDPEEHDPTRLVEALVAACCGDGLGALVNPTPAGGGWNVMPTEALRASNAHKERTRLNWLLRTHQDLLIEAAKDHTLCISWEPKAPIAGISLIPVESTDPKEKFKTFELPFLVQH